MNLLLLPPSTSAYDVLTDFSNQLFDALSQTPHNVYQYISKGALSAQQIINEVQHICDQYQITHLINFNGVGFDFLSDLRTDKTKFIGWLVDYPTYHFTRLSSSLESKYILTSNPNHAAYVNEMTKSTYAGVITLGATSSRTSAVLTPLADRDFDVVFVGSWMDQPERFWEQIKDDQIRKISKDTLDVLLACDTADPYLVLKEQFAKSKLDLAKNATVMNALIMHITNYCRKQSRIKMMNAVVQSGLKTLVVGDGWSDHFAVPHLYFHEPVPNHLMHQIYEKCRIAICLNANNGGCERALQALVSGCAVFSFGGIPIEQLAADNAGIRISAGADSETMIADALRQWHERLMNDTSIHPNAEALRHKYSWRESAHQLIRHIGALESETVTM